MQLLRTWGMSLDLSRMLPAQLGIVQGGRKLQARGLKEETPEGFFFPCEQEINQLIDAKVQALVDEKVQEAIAGFSTPFLIGEPHPVFNRILPNQLIVTEDGWYWLRGDLWEGGTIGNAASGADLADDRLIHLYRKWWGSESDFYAGIPRTYPDIRGLKFTCAGNNPALSDRPIGDRKGEELHLQIANEVGPHQHELPSYVTNYSRSGTNLFPGMHYSGSFHSQHYTHFSSSPQPFNVLNPDIALPVLIFLGVLAA